MWLITAGSLLFDSPEVFEGAEVDGAVGDGRGGGLVFAELVDGEDFEFSAGLDDGDAAVSGGEVESAFGEDRGGAVALAVGGLGVNFSAGVGFKDGEVAVFHAEVDEAVADDGSGNIGSAFPGPDAFVRAGDIAGTIGADGEQRMLFGGGRDDESRGEGGGGDKAECGVVGQGGVIAAIESSAAPDFVAVFQVVSNDDVSTVA